MPLAVSSLELSPAGPFSPAPLTLGASSDRCLCPCSSPPPRPSPSLAPATLVCPSLRLLPPSGGGRCSGLSSPTPGRTAVAGIVSAGERDQLLRRHPACSGLSRALCLVTSTSFLGRLLAERSLDSRNLSSQFWKLEVRDQGVGKAGLSGGLSLVHRGPSSLWVLSWCPSLSQPLVR